MEVEQVDDVHEHHDAMSGTEDITSSTHMTDVSADVSSDTSGISESGQNKPEVTPSNWYQDPKFQRYRQHYEMVWSWYQQHLKNINESRQCKYEEYWRRLSIWMQRTQFYNCLNPQSEWMGAHQQYCRQQQMWQQYNQSSLFQRMVPSMSNNSRQHPHKSPSDVKTPNSGQLKRKMTSPSVHDNEGYDSKESADKGEEGEGEEFEMEITPEMLEFFKHSAKHKEERDAAKREQNKEDGEYVDLAEASTYKKRTTAQAPTERPGVRRTAEMKGLYGNSAAMIHGMETALQLNFDRNCDLKTPRLWPHLPLNIVFN